MPTDQGPNMLLPMIMVFLIFYMLVFRPQRKEQKKLEELRKTLKKNDQVVTTAGIHGTVSLVKEKTVVVRVDDSVKIEFDKESVSSVTKAQS